jgi:lactoylglutathione lyase
MPITRVGTVSLFVNDQERARKFYTEVLGMEVRADEPLFPGASARWLAVAPPGADTEIILYVPDDSWDHYRQVVGKSQALTLEASNMDEVHRTLTARGVKFVQEPQKQLWGTFAIIEDSEGNTLILAEQKTDVPRTKEDLLARIHSSRRSLEKSIQALGEEQLSRRGPFGWSVKDHLAHLATWELGIVELLQKRPRFAAMGVEEAVSEGKTEDEINELIYRRRAHRTAAEVLVDFEEVHARLLQVLERMDEEALFRPYASYLPEGATGSQLPVIHWIAGNTYEHFDEHHGYIGALLESER